ncbi:MAG: CDP-alcohol phosphatidyltransferase family protein [Anaerolineae bacterium]|nr:CDP-alcohol phosphatidyltransferase family protein [Anaerolineae bacterium]
MLVRNRQIYEQVSQSLGRFGLALGVSPNTLTLMGVVVSIIAGALFSLRLFGWVLVALILMAVLDVLDGATARAGDMATPFGGILDHVSDRYAELFVSGGIMLSGLAAPIWVLFGISGALMASYARAKIESMTDIKANVGLAGRQEKALILIAGMIVYMLGIGPGAVQWAIILVGVVSHLTAVQRLLYARKMLAAL